MRSTKSTFGLVGIFAAALLLANLPVASQAAENSQNSSAEKQAKGMQLIGTLLEGTGAGGLPLTEKCTEYTVKHLFGDVWQGDDLSLQDR